MSFLRRPFWFVFCFISVKKAACSYEVSFISALCMVFPESWKRSCPNFYAHDCSFLQMFWIAHHMVSQIPNPDSSHFHDIFYQWDDSNFRPHFSYQSNVHQSCCRPFNITTQIAILRVAKFSKYMINSK